MKKKKLGVRRLCFWCNGELKKFEDPLKHGCGAEELSEDEAEMGGVLKALEFIDENHCCYLPINIWKAVQITAHLKNLGWVKNE
jgi:hypothetical protein